MIADEVVTLQAEVARLTGRVEELLHRFAPVPSALPLGGDPPASMSPALAEESESGRAGETRDLLRRTCPPLPDPRLIRRILRQRRLRARYFEPELFADPAWDILLDLAAARVEHRRVSVTSLCVAAAVPPTTALRWLTQMTAMSILIRTPDEEDRRRNYISLSDSAAESLARYFDELGRDAAKLI